VKIIICTTPIRPVPTNFPPFGSLAVIQALRGAGYHPVFFDIDGSRPSFAEVVERFSKEAPDLIGISAVVSTAYGYVKKLCLALREALPDVKIILGGNLAASAELLHRFCGVDICVIGEGERVIVNLANYFARNCGAANYPELEGINGITYLNPDGEMVFTGYEAAIPANELLDPDFSILEEYSNLGNFVADPFTRPDFVKDSRSHEPHRAGKKMATVVSAKGCVARCTFCHRWDKGFRQIPPARVIARIQYLMDRYNVGFIQFGDENFGSDRRATDELIRLIKPLDVLWQVAGVRARSIDLDLLRQMRDAGCVALYYGFETGSPDILRVMEKNLDLSHNFNAARWTYEAGLFTIYQLVLGMPGETPQTLSETVAMVKQVTEFLPEPPSKYLSINYIQAFPGTPIYEYARARGFIDPTLEGEDAYLLTISDIDAADDTKFLNFTQHPYLTVRTWRYRVLYESWMHWMRVGRMRSRAPSPRQGQRPSQSYHKGGYFNLHDLKFRPWLLAAFYPIRWLPIWLFVLVSEFRHSSGKLFFSRVLELVTWHFRKCHSSVDYRSLRQILKDITHKPKTKTEESMVPLRSGR
jgi:radical SAM superfamily enzyme YgiQ (UPF0313 family)